MFLFTSQNRLDVTIRTIDQADRTNSRTWRRRRRNPRGVSPAQPKSNLFLNWIRLQAESLSQDSKIASSAASPASSRQRNRTMPGGPATFRAGQTDPLFDPQLLPPAGNALARCGIHADLVRPGTRKTLGRPLAGGVNAHLGAEVGQSRGMVERIHRPQRELNVALRIDVVGDPQLTSRRSCTSTSSSTTTMHLVNIAWPSDQMAFMTLRAWPGYDFRIETIIRLWNTPSTGRFTSTSSGMVSFISGRKIRSTAFPIQASSMGGLPTIVVA